MKQCCECKEIKSLNEFSKQKACPDGLAYYCKACLSIRRKQSYGRHRERRLQDTRNWRENNREYMLAYYKAYREANKPRRAAQQNKRRLQQEAASIRIDDSILLAYQACDLLNQVTGEWHEVDHIIPLINENVCGLHVSENLQILTREDNRRKGNKFIPELQSFVS